MVAHGIMATTWDNAPQGTDPNENGGWGTTESQR
jgi:hypothetical protein